MVSHVRTSANREWNKGVWGLGRLATEKLSSRASDRSFARARFTVVPSLANSLCCSLRCGSFARLFPRLLAHSLLRKVQMRLLAYRYPFQTQIILKFSLFNHFSHFYFFLQIRLHEIDPRVIISITWPIGPRDHNHHTISHESPLSTLLVYYHWL